MLETQSFKRRHLRGSQRRRKEQWRLLMAVEREILRLEALLLTTEPKFRRLREAEMQLAMLTAASTGPSHA